MHFNFSGKKCIQLFCDFPEINLTAEDKYLCCECAKNLENYMDQKFKEYRDQAIFNPLPVRKSIIDCPWRGKYQVHFKMKFPHHIPCVQE